MANRTSIKFVAFDLGGVLVNVDKAALTLRLGISTAQIDAAYFETRLFHGLVNGHITSSEYFSQVASILGRTPTDVEDGFRAMVTPRPYCEGLIKRIQAPFTFWSNTNMCHFEHVLASSTVLSGFSRNGGLSFQLGFSKPSSRFFEESIRRSRLKPSEILFLDDKEENIKVARQLDIQAHVVRTQNEIVTVLASACLL